MIDYLSKQRELGVTWSARMSEEHEVRVQFPEFPFYIIKSMNTKIGDMMIDDFLTWMFFPLRWNPDSPERIELERMITNYLSALQSGAGELSDDDTERYFKYLHDNLDGRIRRLIAMTVTQEL